MHWLDRKEIAVLIAALLCIAGFVKIAPGSWNDRSRLATMESLVERGTFVIEGSTFEPDTNDKVVIRGRVYSDKLPMLSMFGAGIYWILHKCGFTFAEDTGVCYFTITFLLVSLASALMLSLFFVLLGEWGCRDSERVVLTAALGAATLIFSYSVTLNNHIITAFAITVALFLILKAKGSGSHRRPRIFLAGIAAGFAPTFEAPSGGVFLLGFFVLVLLHSETRRTSPLFILGAILPLAVHLALNYYIVGDFMPTYRHPEFWSTPYWTAHPPEHLVRKDLHDVLLYFVHSTFGNRGLFSHSPILILTAIFLIRAVSDRTHPYWKESLVIAASTFIVMSYYIFSTTSYGGVGYATRYYVALIPCLFLFGADIYARFRGNAFLKGLFYALAAASLFFSIQGALNPWPAKFGPVQVISEGRVFTLYPGGEKTDGR